ncbi:MAG: C40 family peptidase [Spirochaetia bacterium]|nr:C40 family peptidase [Spirochaetia bacterium]
MRRILPVFLLSAVMLFSGCESLPSIFDCPAVKQKQEKEARQAEQKKQNKKGSNTASGASSSTGTGSSTTTSANTSTTTSTVASTSPVKSTTPVITPVKNTSSPSISQKQKQLVEAANWAKGRRYITIDGHRFKMDCSGVIRAIYFKAGIDLAKDFNKYSGGGTMRIHETLRSRGLIYRPTVPVPGDILFWDNTYDANHNGRSDDMLSHIGMVVSSDKKSGNVIYVHHNEKKGIVFEKMNLLHPDDPTYNAVMRSQRAKKLPGNKYLASHLYKDAGKGYLLR